MRLTISTPSMRTSTKNVESIKPTDQSTQLVEPPPSKDEWSVFGPHIKENSKNIIRDIDALIKQNDQIRDELKDLLTSLEKQRDGKLE